MESVNIETLNDRLLVERLRKDIRSFTENQPEKISFWSDTEIALKNLLETSNPAEFCNWDVIKNTMYYTPHEQEYEYLKASDQWHLLTEILNEDKIGNASGYALHPSASGNLVHHLYSYLFFREKAQFDLGNVGAVCEFGGGYGSFCRLLYNLGFSACYYIFDLPVLSCLQRYFLSHTNPGLPVNYNRFIEQPEKYPQVSLINDMDFLVRHKQELKNIDMFVGLWSISEAPLPLRDFFLENLTGCRYILIGYQKEFEGIDNITYFTELAARLTRYNWHHQEIPCIKDNFYLIGTAD